MSDSTVVDWVRTGRLHTIYPGVYSLGHEVIPVEGRLAAALLYAGPGAALSHTTAAWWWGLIDSLPSLKHVTAPGRHRRQPGLIVHRTHALCRVRHRRLPVATVPRTLLDLAATVPVQRLRHSLAKADYLGRLDPAAVEAELGRGRPGSAALRRALDLHQPRLARTLSELEDRFVVLCEGAGVQMPEVNATVCGFMVDCYWPDHALVVELDGHRGHAKPAAIEVDRGRELVLREAGIAVNRYTWRQVTRAPASVEADLRRSLASAAMRHTQVSA